MHISLITLFALLEVILFLLGATITLGIMLYLRKSANAQTPSQDTPTEQPEATADAVNLHSSYIDYLEQAMQRNQQQMEQQPEENSEAEAEADTESENDEHQTADAQLQLLQARQQFLELEKTAAQKNEDNDSFWDEINTGMQALLAQFKSIEVHTETVTEVQQKKEVKEKVFYIETQGRKVDNEVNKLKDIIYDQENAISSMQKNLAKAIEEAPQESESLNDLHQQFSSLERQILDSKMCMDILETENERLQDELHKIKAGASQNAEQDSDSESTVELSQIKEVVRQQKERIKQLQAIIETLEIDTDKAEELKTHLSEFTRSSEEMMSCITILEEENERLQDEVHTIEDSLQHESGDASESQQLQELQTKINQLEEEVVKKDLALAQLQEEFSSMETEYLAMYEAMQEGKQ
ncbi:MAG TPA: hypothetical protein VIQ81_06310 [Gammaproteobacteria bacterium]